MNAASFGRALSAGAISVLGLALVPSAAGASGAPVLAPLVPAGTTGYSSNWSGYAAHSGTYSRVSASWTEPTGKCGSAATYSSFWVGLDGYGSNTVEQTGSEVDCSGGSPSYYAWYEMYPKYPVNFSNPVRPGDSFSASVTAAGSTFTLVISDSTQRWSHTIHATLSSAKKASAEVIAEAPCCTLSGGILPLADFGTVKFTSAMVDGSAIGSSNPTRIDMGTKSHLKDSTSTLTGGEAFSVKWLRST